MIDSVCCACAGRTIKKLRIQTLLNRDRDFNRGYRVSI